MVRDQGKIVGSVRKNVAPLINILKEDDGKYFSVSKTSQADVLKENLYVTDKKILSLFKDCSEYSFYISQSSNMPIVGNFKSSDYNIFLNFTQKEKFGKSQDISYLVTGSNYFYLQSQDYEIFRSHVLKFFHDCYISEKSLESGSYYYYPSSSNYGIFEKILNFFLGDNSNTLDVTLSFSDYHDNLFDSFLHSKKLINIYRSYP